MFKSILVPVDLTDQNQSVVQIAAEWAKQFGATLTLLHIIETLDVPMDELRDFYQDLESKVAEKLEEFAKPAQNAGIAVEGHFRYGKRTVEIVAFAEDNGHDLIIMRSHRLDPEHPGKGLLTISHQVAIAANAPVLILK